MKSSWLTASVAYFALQLGAPLITLPNGWALVGGVLVSTLLFMATLLWLVFAWAEESERVSWLAPLLLVGGIVAWGASSGLPALLGWSYANPPTELAFGLYRALHGYLLMMAAVGLGATLSKLIREKNLLAPVIPFAAMVDMLTVLTPGGFVKQVM
ncbi:MAG: hypothetical protein ACK4UU_06315, partial [Fimbriimonadales bacterium]